MKEDIIASLERVFRKTLKGVGFPNSVSMDFSLVLFWGVVCPREPISIAQNFTLYPYPLSKVKVKGHM